APTGGAHRKSLPPPRQTAPSGHPRLPSLAPGGERRTRFIALRTRGGAEDFEAAWTLGGHHVSFGRGQVGEGIRPRIFTREGAADLPLHRRFRRWLRLAAEPAT